MIPSLATPGRLTHLSGMRAPLNNDAELKLLGLALQALREERGLSQEAAGGNAKPALTKQAWGLHELGRVKGLLTPDVQARVTAALGLSAEDLNLKRDQIDRLGKSYRPVARVVGGFQARAREATTGPDVRQAVFPLSAGGEVTITHPERLTREGVEELEGYLQLLLKTLRSRAADA